MALYALVGAGAALPPVALLATGRGILWRDTANLYAPLRGFVVAALRDLRLPLWNPHEAMGIPLFAQMMHGVLHPVSVAAAFLAPGSSMDALVTVHVVLAALGATWLARWLGVSRGAAAVAGLGYGLSGYVLGITANWVYLVGAATAPWAMAGLRAAGSGRRGAVPAAALAVAALLFAGDPQWALLACMLGLALAAEAGGVRGLARAAVAVLAGTAVAGVQLLPAWQFLQETGRARGLLAADRSQWALAPARLVELVSPGFFGGRPGVSVVSPVFRWLGGPSVAHLAIPFLPSIFVGAVLLLLAAAGALASRPGRLLAAASVVLLWLALGENLGAEQLLHGVPIWGSFRYAEKFVGPLTLCLALLAAIGTDRLARAHSGRPAAVAGALALAVGAVALWLALGPVSQDAAASELARQAAPLARDRLARGLAHASSGLGLLAGLLATALRWPGFRGALPAAAAVLVFLQSAAAAPFALHAGRPVVRDVAPLASLAFREPPARIVTPLDDPPYPAPSGLDEADRETAALSRMGVAPFAVPSGIDHVNTYTGLSPRRLRLAFSTLGPDLWRALRRFGLTHVVLKQPRGLSELEIASAATSGGRQVLADPAWGFTIWEVPHRSWAAFAHDATPAPTEADALRMLVDAERGGSPETVVVEGGFPPAFAAGTVLATLRRPEVIRVEAVASGDGVLVVNDSFAPGWVATMDGRPWPLWRADFLVRAVPWPEGRHVLEMRYQAPGLRVGIAVSLAGLAAVAALGLADLRARRSP